MWPRNCGTTLAVRSPVLHQARQARARRDKKATRAAGDQQLSRIVQVPKARASRRQAANRDEDADAARWRSHHTAYAAVKAAKQSLDGKRCKARPARAKRHLATNHQQ